jgi:Protein of unknown function (DUF2971)
MPYQSCPPRLYKYFSPERSNLLGGSLLRYTPLGAFNDPFEGRPDITMLSTDEQALQSITELLPQEAKATYDALEAQVRAALPFPAFLKLLQAFTHAKQPEVLQQFRALTGSVVGLIHKKFDEHIGALCLSEVPDSLLMWSHYGASHTGFVVEFDAHHSYFHEQRSAEDEFRHLRRVLYREARPSAPLTDMEATELFLVKSGHWAYEREWRILRALTEADVVVPAEPFPLHLFAFPRGAVTAVILGARSTKATDTALRQDLRSHEEFKAVHLKRALPDSSHFLLRVIDEDT